MSWILQKKSEHICTIPPLNSFHSEIGNGSIWMCDDCGKKYRVFIKKGKWNGWLELTEEEVTAEFTKETK